MDNIENIQTKPCSELKWIENRQYDEHIPHKLKSAGANTQQFKLKLLKMTVYILQIEKKGIGANACLIDIFVIVYDVEALSANLTTQANTFQVVQVILFYYVTEFLTRNYQRATLVGFSKFDLTILLLQQSRDEQLMYVKLMV